MCESTDFLAPQLNLTFCKTTLVIIFLPLTLVQIQEKKTTELWKVNNSSIIIFLHLAPFWDYDN